MDVGALRRAVKIASDANPGTRLVHRGWLHKARLVDSRIDPPVREIDGRDWSGHSFEGVPSYRSPLPLKSGPTSDVILIHGEPLRVLFRGHHAIIDGQGLLMWIEDVFRVLRGEPPLGSGFTESVDQYRNPTSLKEPKWRGGQCVAPTGVPEKDIEGFDFRRISIPGPISALLPKLLLLTAQSAWHYEKKGSVVFGVPISLRQRKPDVRSSSNLSRALYLEITPASTVLSIRKEIKKYQYQDGRLAFSEKIIPFVPVRLLGKIIETGYRKGIETGRYWVSGFLSNVGRFQSKQFSTSNFTATCLFPIPPISHSIPVFAGVISLDDTISIAASMPASLASDGRFDAYMDFLSQHLK